MTKRAIYCPGPRKWLTLGQYVQAVKMAKANPAATFKCGFSSEWPLTGAEAFGEFMAGLEDRINQAEPYSERGLK